MAQRFPSGAHWLFVRRGVWVSAWRAHAQHITSHLGVRGAILQNFDVDVAFSFSFHR